MTISNGNGQPSTLSFAHFGIRDGLSDPSVIHLAQDSIGYIWVATDVGLDRFDGYRFTNHWPTRSNSAVSSAVIQRIRRLNGDRLAVATRDGLHILDTRSMKGFDMLPEGLHEKMLGFAHDALVTRNRGLLISAGNGFFHADSSGKLEWQYAPGNTAQAGRRFGRELIEVDANQILAFNAPDNNARMIDLRDKQVYDINVSHKWKWIGNRRFLGKVADDSGHLYLLPEGSDSIIRCDLSSGTVTRWQIAGLERTKLYWPASLVCLGRDLLAICLAEGGFVVIGHDPVTGGLQRQPGTHLPGTRIRHLLRDHDGRIWAAAEDGLYMQQLQSPPVRSGQLPSNLPGLLPQQEIHGIRWHQGFLWAGLSGRGGVVSIDPEHMRINRQYRFPASLNPELNEVFSLHEVHADTIWLGTRRGLGWLHTGSGRMGLVEDGFNANQKPSIIGIMSDKSGNRWMGLADKQLGLLQINPATSARRHFPANQPLPGFPLASARHITQDSYGNLWFAYMGLTRYNTQTGVFDTLIRRFAGYRPDETDVLSLDADANGNLWLITAGNGLLKLDIRKGEWQHFGLKEGLSTLALRGLTAGITDWIICAGRYDVNLLHLPSGQVRVWRAGEGVPAKLLSTSELVVRTDSSIVYGGFQQAFAGIPVPQEKPGVASLFRNNLLLSEITPAGEASIHHPDYIIRLTYRQSNLQLHFTTLDPEAGSGRTFFYRLDSTSAWQSFGTTPLLSLTKLRPGTYHLQAEARTGHGLSAPAKGSWTIEIHPPWWQQPWFYLLMLIALAAGLWVIYRWRIRSVRRKASLNEKLADYEMKALHAQMNPHFVFNCLNSIKDMILSGENEQASRYLSRFARLIRQTLDQSAQPSVSLQQTIGYLQDYLEMERIRFPDISYSLYSAPALDQEDIRLPPMLVQPLIENAIWHGLRKQQAERILHIDFLQEGKYLECRVADNGPGLETTNMAARPESSDHLSISLINIRKRLALINEKFGTHCRLEITNRTDATGVRASLYLPLRMESQPAEA